MNGSKQNQEGLGLRWPWQQVQRSMAPSGERRPGRHPPTGPCLLVLCTPARGPSQTHRIHHLPFHRNALTANASVRFR